jgi:hypothetical protein
VLVDERHRCLSRASSNARRAIRSIAGWYSQISNAMSSLAFATVVEAARSRARSSRHLRRTGRRFATRRARPMWIALLGRTAARSYCDHSGEQDSVGRETRRERLRGRGCRRRIRGRKRLSSISIEAVASKRADRLRITSGAYPSPSRQTTRTSAS